MAKFRYELSDRNPWKLEKHRMLELKHFCLQYPVWRQELFEMTYIPEMSRNEIKGTNKKNLVEDRAIKITRLRTSIELIHKCCKEAAPDLEEYIFKAVTRGCTYESFIADGIPACRDTFYDRYRRFFWLLDKYR